MRKWSFHATRYSRQTIKAYRLLYLPPGSTFKISTGCSHSVCVVFVRISQKKKTDTFTSYNKVIFRRVRNLQQATTSWVISVCLPVLPSAWNNRFPPKGILIKFDIYIFFKNLSRKFKFH